MSEYSNLKLYNLRGDRVAAFARVNGESLDYFVVRTSRKDQFNKELARRLWEEYKETGSPNISMERMEERLDKKGNPVITITVVDFHPLVFSIPIVDGKPKKSFIEYNEQNWLRKRITKVPVMATVEYLQHKKGGECHVINKKPVYVKTLA